MTAGKLRSRVPAASDRSRTTDERHILEQEVPLRGGYRLCPCRTSRQSAQTSE
ncbi:hypothetical protein SAMN05428939_7233 [Streptomyces sp. TLI_105]|nr:hypothetical protein SAMN05428939_7233 [Streptomyces sp. TLI_105]